MRSLSPALSGPAELASWVPSLAACFVVLDKAFLFSESQSPHPQNEQSGLENWG